MKRKVLIIISFILFLLFLMLYLFNKVNIIDTYFYNLIISIKCNFVTNLMKFITFFASTKFILGIVIILFIVSLFKRKIPLIMNWLILGEVVINNIVKVIVKRKRPMLINMVTEKTYSFPSGHTMVSVVFYGFIIYLVSKLKIDKKYKYIINVCLTILIILIMMSRIYLGVHYFSDVIAGACLSTTYLLIIIDVLERRNLL